MYSMLCAWPALQLRDVPDDLHRELKARAARSGQSLSDYTLGVLQQHVASPTLPELIERIVQRAAVEPEIPCRRADPRGAGRTIRMTLVFDASALVEFVLGSSRGREAAMVMSGHEGALHAPGLIMTESLSALRALERRTNLTAPRADQAVDDLLAVPLHKYGTETLVANLVPAWSYHCLRRALRRSRQGTGSPLLTGDHRLASATEELIEVITV